MRERVLVVDDDEAIRETVTMVLSGEGYQVHTAGTGVEGLVALASLKADVVLVDLRMPDMDGTQFCRRFAAQGGTAPTILMTAAARSVSPAEAPGVIATLVKPFDIDDLLRAVSDAVAGRPSSADRR